MEATPDRYTISQLCRAFGVSRSGYYNWLHTKNSRNERDLRDFKDFLLIKEAYDYRGYKKGARSIYMNLLNKKGIRMNQKKIRRLMKKYNLVCPIRKHNPYKQMVRALKTNAVADNHLKREFLLHGARAVLLTDITYIPLNKYFCYLSVIKDAFTKEILSYVLSESLEVDFVLATVNQLIKKHGTNLSSNVMIHSDQGCHYTSVKFRELINNYHLRQSMSRRGNCWDNAPQESFFGHMKTELIDYSNTWTTIEEVQATIDDWMDYYNNERYQWSLNKMAPTEYYNYIKSME